MASFLYLPPDEDLTVGDLYALADRLRALHVAPDAPLTRAVGDRQVLVGAAAPIRKTALPEQAPPKRQAWGKNGRRRSRPSSG